MFIEAIEKAGEFTRPIHTILRTYGGKKIVPGAATLFFVNDEGYAITCKHVVEMLFSADKQIENYKNFKAELTKIARDGKYAQNLKGLEIKYKMEPETVIQVKNTFKDCVDVMSGFTCHVHAKYDLAIIKFNDFNKIGYNSYAIFKKDDAAIKQGQYLCRLGFPFPEFNNFLYNEITDDIEWTTTGNGGSPRFPIEGMVTRFLAEENKMYGIEMSTPGLRGQSGGPLFDKNGVVCGMQSSTKHLHLGFDMEDIEIVVKNKPKNISDYSFIHLGQCIHANVIKDFLKEMNVKYYEENDLSS
jgi:Trypsin-like peptidase domain